MSCITKLAEAIRLAQKIREESYDKAAARKAEEESVDAGYNLVDYSEYYMVTLEEASRQASVEIFGNEGMERPIFMLNYSSWNDADEWALTALDMERRQQARVRYAPATQVQDEEET